MINDEGGVIAQEGIPTGEMTLYVECEATNVRKVFTASDHQELAFNATDAGICITVPSVDVHEIIVIDQE